MTDFKLPREHRTGSWENFVWWWIIGVLTSHASKEHDGRAHKVPGWEKIHGGNLDIEFKINGVEIHIDEVMKRWQESFDWEFKRAAMKVYNKKFRKLIYKQMDKSISKLQDIESYLRTKKHEIKEELGIEDW